MTLQTQIEAACKTPHIVSADNLRKAWLSHNCQGGHMANSEKCQRKKSWLTYERHLDVRTSRCCRWLVLRQKFEREITVCGCQENLSEFGVEFGGLRWVTTTSSEMYFDNIFPRFWTYQVLRARFVPVYLLIVYTAAASQLTVTDQEDCEHNLYPPAQSTHSFAQVDSFI